MAETLTKIRTDTHDSSRSSSSSASRYNLDEDDKSPILVYEWRGGLSTSTQSKLSLQINTDEQYSRCRVTTKPIPKFQAVIEVKRHDLYLDDEKERYQHIPNYDNSLASIKLPSNVYWGRVFTGSYDNLYILSPETSPTHSDTGSRKLSRTGTWGSEDADGGAEKHDD